ncbi:hypothetical protein NDU88_002677 [Pleurodeles waltl]|uniref:Uncharacterized protein n=1 Tax=Pleurodeles waltl TaxID=8319 RepID=A0AAV7M350_PLEWA|nr:hypothetical protein NDU88_002677 [Pleurodeles waltl]
MHSRRLLLFSLSGPRGKRAEREENRPGPRGKRAEREENRPGFTSAPTPAVFRSSKEWHLRLWCRVLLVRPFFCVLILRVLPAPIPGALSGKERKPSFESRQVLRCCQVTNASAAILGYFRCGRGSASTSPGRVWVGSERPITGFKSGKVGVFACFFPGKLSPVL